MLQDRVVEALFAGNFTRGDDIGDHAVLARIAADCGLDPARVETALAEPARSDTVVREDADLHGQGSGGVPTFVLGGYSLISGAQPAKAMVGALRDAAVQIRAMAPRQVEPAGARSRAGSAQA